MLKAVIFDMDGVIIDSEPMHARAAILALEKYHVNVTMEYLQQFIGSTTYYMCQKLIGDFHIDASPDTLFTANNEMKSYLLEKEGHTVVPYVIALIKDLHKHGVKLSIASSSPAEAIIEVMEALKIKEYFHGFVSGMTVSNPKPAPDIFLEAAKNLGISPEDCIVIEDSSHGVNAAKAAGMTCVGFVNPNSGDQDLSNASLLVEGFEEVDYAFLNQIYQFENAPRTITATDRFIIRELTEADISDLFPIYQQPGIRKYLQDFSDSLEIEKQKQKAYISNIYHFYGFGMWGVFLRDSGKLIGRCGIELKSLDGRDIYEVGYLLDTNYQGRGYAKEFLTAVLNYCFTELDIHTITAVIDKNNTRSLHLAEQVGMLNTGETLRNHQDCFVFTTTYHQ